MNHDAALAFLVSTYAKVSPEKVEKPAKAPKIAKVAKAPKTAKAVPLKTGGVCPLPEGMDPVGTLSASEFLIALQDVGKRLTTKTRKDGSTFTMMVCHPLEVRPDTIRAIGAYCGYDSAGDFGTQDYAARTRANREIMGNVIDDGSRHRACSHSVGGFVAGMVDAAKKRRDDLIAREKLAVNAMCEFERTAKDPGETLVARQLAASLAAVESERIAAIRKEKHAL